jgi:hypothetical protein
MGQGTDDSLLSEKLSDKSKSVLLGMEEGLQKDSFYPSTGPKLNDSEQSFMRA